MKVSELQHGKIYTCNLSGQDVLVFRTPKQFVKDHEGKEVAVPSKKIGKICVKLDNGDFKYIFVDLHDGQIKCLKSNS